MSTEKMPPKKEDTEKPVLQRIADQLLVAQQEIDDLALQLALGKAEAREKFQEVKKEFRHHVAEFKVLVKDMPGSLITPEVRQKIDELEVQLALGKAETKEEFETQKQKLTKTLEYIEHELREWFNETERNTHLGHEFQKFKLKMEILRLKLTLKKFELRDGFKDKMSTARREIEKMGINAKSAMATGKKKYTHFTGEVSTAYSHLKKAIKELN